MFRNKAFNIALLTIIAVVLIGILGLVGYKMFWKTDGAEPEVPTAKELLASQFEIGKMTTNLAGNALIQATISVQGDSTKMKTELEERKVQVKDVVNSVLHKTTPADLEKAEGIELLKVKLIGELNKVMLEGKVTNVYISDIVVQ
ncbi:flagellar basal body-associated FliL family protein [Tumebacillus permanentifrigoris]|uniref:Flagellar protein FliL n=1 Tax=Tumebacillus permanentifrigoris TaxID=378543 RepID=A0A316D9C6_9BACL|nr:flagellar basal body-associated FliL family protein [Tumebacillus permanentifrigoris]PWK12704.1 flagellar basal body-associated protein FliL [Tumebacillus permanentifrigoris]